MFTSLRLGKWFGIDVFIHATFWILPLFVMLSALLDGEGWSSALSDVLLVLSVFACVLMHEFGHALAARMYGISTRRITLYPLGGVAVLESMPERPIREIAVTLAGPAVNLVIAAGLVLGRMAGTAIAPSVVLDSPLYSFLDKLAFANLFLFGFNLLPAFPMDGGRLLRALLAMRLNRVRATAIAVGVGTVVAGVFLVAGLLIPSPGLIFVAVAVFLLGQAELAMMRAKEWGRGFRGRIADLARPVFSPEGSAPDGPPSPGFSGLAWDGAKGVWVEWKNGIRVGSLGRVEG